MSKFYKCPNHGIIAVPEDVEDITVTCCGEEVPEITANTTDAALEKHVPVVKINDNIVKVEVGDVHHPMLDEHYITDIYLDTNKGNYKKKLTPGQEPVVTFVIDEDEIPETVYEYCNLHGLWKKEL